MPSRLQRRVRDHGERGRRHDRERAERRRGSEAPRARDQRSPAMPDVAQRRAPRTRSTGAPPPTGSSSSSATRACSSGTSSVDDDPGSRLRRALGAAAQTYAATPERDRGYRPDEAVRALCHYAAISIAIGSRSLERRAPRDVARSSRAVRAPVARRRPDAVEHDRDVRSPGAARKSSRRERGTSSFTTGWARSRRAELPYVDVLRNAIAFALGSIEARMGLASATSWIELLEKDLLQQVNALLLRKVLALQVGDAEGAERYRRQAELLALQARVRQMFTTTVPTELAAHALAGDLERRHSRSRRASRRSPTRTRAGGPTRSSRRASSSSSAATSTRRARPSSAASRMTSPDPGRRAAASHRLAAGGRRLPRDARRSGALRGGEALRRASSGHVREPSASASCRTRSLARWRWPRPRSATTRRPSRGWTR